jgi:hypothetical protein
MGTGYTRKDTVNNIADGNIINASDLDLEFDGVQAAFDAATGHTHDGTTGEGAPIEVTGPAQEYVSTGTELRPKANNTYDLGSSANQWKDLYVDGTANLDTVDIDAGSIDGTTIGAATPAAGTFTTAAATTGNITTVNATTVDTTNIEVTNIKAKDGTAAGSIADSTGVVTIASSVLTTTDINGGTIDGTTIGGASAAAGTFTTATATTGNITTVNATTVDSTNVEVTNIKAKDGTASATIADSTGVMTIASSVLTTADINGGTIDGTVIGGSTPAAITGTTGQFGTSLNVGGTITSDGLTVDGVVGLTVGNTIGAGLGYAGNTSSAGAGKIDFYDASTGALIIDGFGPNFLANSGVKIRQSGQDALWVQPNGDISFYEDTGTTPKFFWDASTERLGIGNTTPATALDVTGTITSDGLVVDTTSGAEIIIFRNDTSLVNGDFIGGIKFGTNDSSTAIGTPPHFSAGIKVKASGTVGLMDMHLYAGQTNEAYEEDTPSMTLTSAGDISFYDDTGTTPKFFWDASAESLGIGTSSPTELLDVRSASGNAVIQARAEGTTASDNAILRLSIAGTVAESLLYFGDSDDSNVGQIRYDHATDFMSFQTSASERMRIDSSGNVGIGTSSPTDRLEVAGVAVAGSATAGTTGSLVLRSRESSDITRVSIGALRSSGAAYFGRTVEPSTTVADGFNSGFTGTSGGGAWTIYNDGSTRYLGLPSGAMTKGSAVTLTERARIDASGNLLVGTTTYVGNSSTDTGGGFGIDSTGTYLFSTRDGETPAFFNRLTSDGDIAAFRKDGTTVGSIGASSSSLTIGTGDTGLRFVDAADAIAPYSNNTGLQTDGTTDIGRSSFRFNDIYATNGTIQTSDRNEKQDIEELDEAERRVAVACKGLLRKFRWKDAVEEKGDEARIHFGIIAQDLQAAFEAEGLDAGRYAMFIHSTWTDEETGEERSRMGVRYSELLAFIIAAI